MRLFCSPFRVLSRVGRVLALSVIGIGLSFAASASAADAAAPKSEQQLNVIVMLVDDMGATDLGCAGSSFYETPNIDQLAREGMRFTQAYSACTVCSPTRASLLTGKNPAVLRVTDWISGHKRPNAKLRVPDWTKQLVQEEQTLAELLKARGYATASIGKWHLGDNMPTDHGFDVNVAGTSRGQPPSYFSPYKIPTLTEGPEGEFLSDRMTAETEKFIEQHKDRPFFVYLPHFAVHTPLQGKPEVIKKYRDKARPDAPQNNPVYAALVESVDDSVGRLRAKVKELGIDGRTVFIFASDNGGLLGGAKNRITTNLGLRAGKGSAYEGGVRVPFIVYWPGVTKPGSTSDVQTITGDCFYTVLEMAGAPQPPSSEYRSLVPLLRGVEEPAASSRALYWHYPHYHPGGATPYSAIREGDWRLIEFFEDDRIELYSLKNDPAEQQNLASTDPEKAAALRAKLHTWRDSVQAQMPTPNPDYDPAKAQVSRRK